MNWYQFDQRRNGVLKSPMQGLRSEVVKKIWGTAERWGP